jgi:hypothetical protein
MTTHAAAKAKLEPPSVMIPVDSSNVAALGHDSRGLFVRFKSGETYLYHQVPESAFHRALSTDSVGGFVHKNIKSNYRTEKL